MRLEPWKLGSGLGVLAAVGYLLSGDLLVRETIWRVVLVAASAGIVWGVRHHRPARRHPWWLLLSALLTLLVANLVDYPLWAVPAATAIADGLAMLAFPLIGLGALALTRTQVPGGDRDSAIDGAIVMIAMATVLAGTAYHPDTLAGEVALSSRLLHTVVAPLMMSAISAASFRVLFVGSLRNASAWFMVTAAVTALLGNTARAVLLSQGTYERGVPTDVLVLIAYIVIALAALHPSMTELSAPVDRRYRRFTYARLVVLGGSLLAAPATLLARGVSGEQLITVLSSMLLGLLVLWRLSRLAMERERTRAQLRRRAERQQVLADLGRRALHGRDVDGLIAEAMSRCADLLETSTCEVVDPGLLPARRGPALPGQAQLPVEEEGRILRAERATPFSAEDHSFLAAITNLISVAIERQATQEMLHDAAVRDALTGLPNRTLILDRLGHSLVRRHPEGTSTHVLFVDLDGFKRVNDDLGHQAGDEVLMEVARRLLGVVRAEDTVGRLAGDEFVVVCDALSDEAAHAVATRVTALLQRPYQVDDRTVRITASLGLAAVDDGVRDAEQALAQADTAMYVAKGQPGPSMATFDEALGAAHARRRTLERELERAVAEDELALVFQPLWQLDGNATVGAEALLRWDHPEQGRLGPGHFLPIAELSDLILPVGDWVLERAFEHAARWQEQLDDDVPWTLFVNLAGRQLADPRLVGRVEQLLARHRVRPERIGFEVSEMAVVDDRVVATANALVGLGVRLAMDDFGAGFSSIAHLRKLPLDVLKLDGSLAANVVDGPQDRAIVRAVCAIAHELGMQVLAERIETAEQRAALQGLGCHLGQGFHLGFPVEPELLALPTAVHRSRDGGPAALVPRPGARLPLHSNGQCPFDKVGVVAADG